MEVKNLPTFDRKKREERSGFIFSLFGVTVDELIHGKDKQAAVQQGDFKKA